MADTTVIRNNASVDLPSRAQAPSSSHTFVPVDSLTNSPTSSTGSASVLDWNSNSDGEVLEWPFSAPPTPPTLTALSSPPVSSSSNTLNSPVESNSDNLVKSRPSFDSSEPENVPEPCNSTLEAELSRTLSEQFQLFNLIDGLQNTILSDRSSPAGATAAQFPHFNYTLPNEMFSSVPSPAGAVPSQDIANVLEHVSNDDDIYEPSTTGGLRSQSPSPFSNTPAATPDTSLSSTSTHTILASGGDSSATSMTTVTPVASPTVASSFFLPPPTNLSDLNPVDVANTQGVGRPSLMPFITHNSTPTHLVGPRTYATSETSTEAASRIEYQSVLSRSPSPPHNNSRPTWRNGFRHNSWLGYRESPSTDPGIDYPGVCLGLFRPSPSPGTSPVPDIPVLEQRITSDLHANGTTFVPNPSSHFRGYSQSDLSTSSVEIGRRGEPQVDIPSWLRAAPPSTIPKVEIPTAIQGSESIRCRYPSSNSFPHLPVPPVAQPARSASTNRLWEPRQRARPPLPPLPPHAQVTPQFALRSHSPNSDIDPSNYFAEAIPSRWNDHAPASPQSRPMSPASTSVSNSPWPATQPLSPRAYPPHFQPWQRRTPNPPPSSGWGAPVPRPAYQSAFWGSKFPASRTPVAVSSPWGTFGSNNRAQTTGSGFNSGYPLPGFVPPCPNPWTPAQRRLRFAPLPPTPGTNVNNANAPRSQPPPPPPPTLPQPPVPPLSYNFQPLPVPDWSRQGGYLYSTPAPVIPMPTSQLDMYTPSTKFWLSDGTVIFRVENSLYKVHRHFFEIHSEHFKKLLSTYWFSPMSHLFLPEIKKTEFEMLLSIFYPTDLTKPDITTVEGWTSILALSYKYTMPQLESLSIQNLHALTTPVQKIALAKKFDFGKKHHHSWLIPAYVDLCSRDAPLSLEEAEQLDMPTVIMVWNVRHAVGVVMARGRRGVVVQDELVLRLVKENWGLGQEEEDHHEDMNGNGNGNEFDAMWPDFQFAG